MSLLRAIILLSCVVWGEQGSNNYSILPDEVFIPPVGGNDNLHSIDRLYKKAECNAGTPMKADVQAGWWGNGNFKLPQALDALYRLQDLVLQDCNRKQFYVYGDGVIVGAWFGEWVHPQGAYNLVSALIYDVSQYGVPGGKAVEYCNKKNKPGYMMGITVDVNSNISGIKQTVDSWINGTCVTQWGDGHIAWPNQALQFYSSTAKKEVQEDTVPAPFNSVAATYEIKAGDTCASIKSDLSLAADLEYFNKYTYGWFGCDAIVPGQVVAVSGGWPSKLSNNHLFEIGTWMDAYESAYVPELLYSRSALDSAKLQLLTYTMTNYTLQVETVYLAMWSGAWVDNSEMADALDFFGSQFTRFGTAKLFQHANENDSEMTFGIIVTNNSVIAKEAMHAWQEGRRYSKGSSFSTLVSGPLYTRDISKNGTIKYPDLEINQSRYSKREMEDYVFAHKKAGDVAVDKFYSTIAAAKSGIPSVQLDVAKHPAFPLDKVLTKAVYGPVDNDTINYFKKQQWVYDGGSAVADSPGNKIEELEEMVDKTTDVDIGSCTMPIFIVNAGYQSPGMACTAYAHMSKTKNNVFTYDGNSVMANQAPCAKQRNPRITGIPILEKHTSWQQATFPYGATGTSQCVDASDAWIEGQSFQRFINAKAAEVSVGKADRFKELDWTRCNPMDPSSPARDGPLAANQQYMMLIEYPPLGFGNCSIEYTRG